ncbi:Na+/H+ antiporter subunit E [Ramlibacter sp. AW1]|uniref:Na+/H+ antiporter subunit E n=1 Tax=Ramlibacter aurantiacus TaxID=2801330 RepID=A0A937D4U3_9BURK|nr:Na+/H+ antiporter subunit E [Ramlibacter aurantiacus]MBL0420667.1 Na+/H+ antiporter subunit E [Ramlibacter aurantiacus]
MKRVFPHPKVSLALWLTWLLLNETVAAGHLLLGAALAWLIPLWTSRLDPLRYPRLKRPWALLRLLWMATVEIARSCVNVSRIILFADPQGVRSMFLRVPLDIRHPFGLAVLSCLINSTPGTVWVEILPGRDGRDELALHVFDLQDPQWWIDTIKQRYEQPLIEIFEEVT